MSEKTLSILFRKDGFSFCILKNAELVYSGHVSVQMDAQNPLVWKEITEKHPYLGQKYQRVIASILSPQFLLIPQNIFKSDKDPQKWLEFNAEIYENDYITSAPIPDHDAELIYAFPNEIKNWVKSEFGLNDLQNASLIFIKSILSESDIPQFFVNVHQDCLEILLLQKDKILFYNIFETQSREDVVYYILNVYHQLQQDTNTIELYYFGWTEDNDYLKMLMKFVRHVIPGSSDLNLMKHYTEITQII
ncbi:MAG: DUF3822 family protein [Flavobacteriaceae bacterium]|nr:DUF3822 family protein [Flavobacteriaceae bacterium]